MKKRWWVLGSLGVVALGCAGWANRRLFTVHDITTGESDAYPELRSRVYYANTETVMLAARQAVNGLPRWQTPDAHTQSDALDATVTTSFGGLTDDVTVYADALDGGQTRAVIRARTRHGWGEGGRSAAHIRQLQDAMDARLTRDAAF